MATGSISQIKLPNGSTYDLKDAGLRNQTGVLSSDGVNVAGVSENYFRPTVKVFDADPVRTDLSVIKLSADDYYELVANEEALSNVIYVVDDDKINAFDQQIKNLAAGIDDTDAVNMAQLNEVSSRAADTYTKSETDQKIASAQYFKKYVVQTLPPVADADERGIYLVPSGDQQTSNTYDEYVIVGEGSSKAWEKIGAKNIDLSGYKTKQTAKTSPTASNTTNAFIDTITQNENGEISATKKTVQSATTSQAGIVQLNNTLTSTSTTQAATANVVKSLNDSKVATSIKVAGQALTADVTAATISSAIGLSSYLPLKGGTIANPNGFTELWLADGKTNGYAELGVEKGNHYIELYCTSADSYIDADNYTYRFPNKNGTLARQEDLNYALSTATGVLSSGSYVYDVADRTVTTISINQSTTPVIVRLPDAGTGARDFILRIEISSETAPTFTFTNTAGLDFESEDDDWAIMEPGVNLVSFTETKR